MKRRGIVENTALALAGDLSMKAGMLVLMMVAARGLSTAQFALLASALATATLLTSGLDLGSQLLLSRDGVSGPHARGALLLALARARAPLAGVCLISAVVIGIAGGHLAAALATVALGITGAVQLSVTGALRSAQDLRPEALSKLAGGLATIAAGAACAAIASDASAILWGVTAAGLLTLAPMLLASRRAISRGPEIGGWRALARALPLGMMGLATLAYYRSGTIVLSLVSSSRQTAMFAAASTIGWGLLAVGNALTTGLLPRLAAASADLERATVTRRALVWMAGLGAALATFVVALDRPLLTLAFGARYGGATTPLAILAVTTVLVGASGVLGTALIAAGRIRPVAWQVAASLVVNLLALALLAPGLGATGAALATLACECLALLMLTRAALRELPGFSVRAPRSIRRSRPAGTGSSGPVSAATGPVVPAPR